MDTRAKPVIGKLMANAKASFYFIRHAQSRFNAAFEQGGPDPMMFDAELSELGLQQAQQVQQNVQALNISRVIVSPFTRTLQTASLIFGDDHPFEVNALIREQLSNSCDVGSHPEKLKRNYPHLDFGHLADCWWHDEEKDHRGISVESHQTLVQRADSFVACLQNNQSHSTAIVSHGNFIHAITGIQLTNCQIVKFDPANRIAQLIDTL